MTRIILRKIPPVFALPLEIATNHNPKILDSAERAQLGDITREAASYIRLEQKTCGTRFAWNHGKHTAMAGCMVATSREVREASCKAIRHAISPLVAILSTSAPQAADGVLTPSEHDNFIIRLLLPAAEFINHGVIKEGIRKGIMAIRQASNHDQAMEGIENFLRDHSHVLGTQAQRVFRQVAVGEVLVGLTDNNYPEHLTVLILRRLLSEGDTVTRGSATMTPDHDHLVERIALMGTFIFPPEETAYYIVVNETGELPAPEDPAPLLQHIDTDTHLIAA